MGTEDINDRLTCPHQRTMVIRVILTVPTVLLTAFMIDLMRRKIMFSPYLVWTSELMSRTCLMFIESMAAKSARLLWTSILEILKATVLSILQELKTLLKLDKKPMVFYS